MPGHDQVGLPGGHGEFPDRLVPDDRRAVAQVERVVRVVLRGLLQAMQAHQRFPSGGTECVNVKYPIHILRTNQGYLFLFGGWGWTTFGKCAHMRLVCSGVFERRFVLDLNISQLEKEQKTENSSQGKDQGHLCEGLGTEDQNRHDAEDDIDGVEREDS